MIKTTIYQVKFKNILQKSKTFLVGILILAFFGLSSEKCSKPTNAQKNVAGNTDMNEILDKSWFLSMEESTQEFEIFRPEGFKFPPARGREGFKIFKDGKFTQLSIAPQDGTQENKGTWTLEDTTLNINVTSQTGTIVKPYKMQVLEANSKILKVKRIF